MLDIVTWENMMSSVSSPRPATGSFLDYTQGFSSNNWGNGTRNMPLFIQTGLGPVTDILRGEATVSDPRPSRVHDEQLTDAIRIMDTFVTPTVCTFGCLGNLISLLVLMRARFRKPENAGKDTGAYIGLFLLAASDLLVCISLLPRGFVRSTQVLFHSAGFKTYYQVYSTGVTTTFILTSTWITVTMAVMRYLGICYPFWSRSIMRQSRTKITYVTVIVLAVCLNIPMFFHYKLTEFHFHQMTYYIADVGYMDPQMRTGMAYYYVRTIFALLLPAVALLFCNFSLIKTLQHSRQLRLQYGVTNRNSRGHQGRVTLTLIIIAIAFIALVLPPQLMDFFVYIIMKDAGQLKTFAMCRALTNLLEIINFSFNFVLYFSMNSQFRSGLSELWPLGSKRNASNRLTATDRKSFIRSLSGSSRSGSSRLTSSWSFTRSKSAHFPLMKNCSTKSSLNSQY